VAEVDLQPTKRCPGGDFVIPLGELCSNRSSDSRR
jgi:hypothetical protein